MLRLGQTWEVATWEIAHLGSCHLGKYPWEVATWENTLGKLPLGKNPLGKYLTYNCPGEKNKKILKMFKSSPFARFN